MAVLTGLAGCIPFKGDVNVYGAPVGPAARPLAAGDGIAILAQGGAAEDSAIAGCVKSAVADASPATRIVPAKEFRKAVGGILAGAKTMLTDEETGRAFREAMASSALADSKLRYVFMVSGATDDRNWHDSATAGVGVGSSEKSTHIEAAAWDAATGEKIDSFSTSTSGHPTMVMIAFITFWEYAPTESAACKDMARKILRYVSGENSAA
jgi:hypothetical protein